MISRDSGETNPQSNAMESSPGAVVDERTSLLPSSQYWKPRSQGHDDEEASIQTSDSGLHDIPQNNVEELKTIVRLAGPVILAYTLQMSFQTVSIFIIGRAYPEHLATAGFAYAFATVTGWLVAIGATTAFDTLASSSFTGSEDKHALGVLLQRAVVVLTMMYIPVAVLWAFSRPLFVALGQDPQVSHDACIFLRWLIPGGFGFILLEVVKKYLQAQEIVNPQTYILSVAAVVSAVLNYVLVTQTELGAFGGAIATGIGFWIALLGLLAYIRFQDCSHTWGGWDRRCFRNMGGFVKLSILGLLHLGTEWWAFEIITILAGQLGTLELAAQSAILTLDSAIVTVPFGIAVASATRVGHSLGRQDPKGAARAAHVAAVSSAVTGLIIGLVLLLMRHQVARIFTSDDAIAEQIAKVLPYVAVYQVGDGLNASCGGALRGMGRQHQGAIVNMAIFYCIALPLGAWLAFHGWNLSGLWIGQAGALLLIGTTEWLMVAFTDWNVQVSRAIARLD